MTKIRRQLAQKLESYDKPFLILIGLMLVFGVIMIHNATVVYSQDLFGGGYRFVFLQLGWISVGLVGFLFFFKLDHQKISRVAYLLFVLALIPLAVLALLGLLTKLGILTCGNSIIFTPCINGAYRWLYLNPAPLPRLPLLGVLGFQPSELMKFALILYLAVQLNKNKNDPMRSFWVYLVTSGVVAGLIVLQPNMSTAALTFLIATCMYFSSNGPVLPLFLSMPVFGALGTIFMLTSEYRRERLFTLLGLTSGEELSLGYHIKQILIALGSGGIFGLGFGQSRQKFQYLPEVASDSIFAIIGEELGFIGTTFVVMLFGFFIYKGLSIAKKATDNVGRMLAVGITSWMGLQFFVNIAAMTKLIPLTGVPLPLISYGGSSMIFSLMGLGVLASIGRKKE